MPDTTSLEQVRASILKFVDPDPAKITPEARLEEDLDCDSLDMVEIVMDCEEAFDIEIDDEIFDEPITVQGLADAIDKIRSEAVQ